MDLSSSRPRTRGYKKRERTRRSLLDAGVETFAKLGGGLTVRDVVECAGVSNGTFYNYFDDLDTFIEEVAIHVLRGVAEAVAFSGSDDPAQRFAFATYKGLSILLVRPLWAQVILRIVARPAAAAQLTHFLAIDLAEGHSSGRFTLGSDTFSVDLVLGAMVMTARRIALGSMSQAQLGRVVQRLLEVLGVDPEEAAALVANAVANSTSEHFRENLQ